jgi:SAM-dependent methyltransferase
MTSSPIARVLEPEVMDTAEEAHDYDAMDHAGVNAAFCDDLLAARPSPRWVLDLGTGTARIPLTLCAKCPDVRVVATDLARHMLRLAEANVARAGLEGRVTLRLDDAKAPEPHPEPFDVVASNSVVHHIPEPLRALAAWWERVPPGALFFVRDLLRPDTEADVLALVERHGGPTPEEPTARASHERQLDLFRASLRAALRLDEVRDIARALGIPEGAVTRTSDRHFTLSYERPR